MAFLEVDDLLKRYLSPDGEVLTVLDIPHFEMGEEQQIAIEGRSGSGKTTFLNLIAGILRPDAGTVRIDGTEVGGLAEGERDAFRARNLGYVFQTFNLLGGYTALENVLLGMVFGPGPDRAFARSLLERLGLDDRMNHRPSQLSIGQQQRVALARALANRPRLVLADEPTGNLDVHHARTALGLIRELCREQGAALLLVSHDREVLESFEQRSSFAELNLASAESAAGIAGAEGTAR